MSRKSAELGRGIYRNDSVWDKLVFGKVHGNLGGRVKAVFSGSAPLDPKVSKTFVKNNSFAHTHAHISTSALAPTQSQKRALS